MKFRYDKEDDVLMVWLSPAKVDYAEKARNIVTHFSKTGQSPNSLSTSAELRHGVS